MATPDNLCGHTLGEFVLRELIGEGGFGAVYRGDQPLLGREVAVKVLHQRLHGDDEALQRFKREALLASRLDHPYAAHIYASGVEPDEGLVWIAMEFVHGVTLNRWLQTHGPLPLEEFVSWFERVAEIMQAVHEQGIVHRDVKPSNVMVIERAGRLLPKLLDLGIAKLVGDVAPPLPLTPAEMPVSDDDHPVDDPGRTVVLRGPGTAQRPRSPQGLTRSSATMGSPPYMAPEQWIAPTDVGPAADRYALGVVAFEALTGRPPFRAHTPREYCELHRLAVVPSLGPAFSLALDRVFERALAKDPADRFASALDLAAALRSAIEALPRMQIRRAARQWQERGRPVEMLWRGALLAELERWMLHSGGSLTPVELEFVDATREHEAKRVASEAERMASVKRRRATWVRRIAVAAAVLMVGVVFSVFQIKAAVETRMARQEARTAQRITEVTEISAEREQGRAALLHHDLPEAREHLIEAHRRGDRSPATDFMLARSLQPLRAEVARFAASSGRMWSATWSPDGARLVTTDDHAAQVWDVVTRKLIATLPHTDTVYEAAFSSDGARIVTASADGTVRIWRTDGAPIRELTRAHQGRSPVRYGILALTTSLVAAIDTKGAVVHIWDIANGAPVAELALDGSEYPSLAFSPDGRWLAATGGVDVRIFDARTWQRALTIGGRARRLSWDPTGSRIATASTSGDVSIWAIPSGERVRHLREIGTPVERIAYSPDGRLVATGDRDGSQEVWSAATGELVSQVNQLHAKVLSIEFDSTSHLVVAAGASGAIGVSDAAQGMEVTLLDGASNVVRTAHFDPTSRRVLGASWDGTARIWDASSPYRSWMAPPAGNGCGPPGPQPDQRFAAVVCVSGMLRIWDTAHNELIGELSAAPSTDGESAVQDIAVSATGDRAAVARGASLERHVLPGGRLLGTITHSAAVTAVAFGPDSRDVISGAADGSTLVTREGSEPRALPVAGAAIDAVALLGDGRAVTVDAALRLRVIAGDRVLAQHDLPSRVRSLVVSPDMRRLVAIPDAPEARIAPTLWDLANGRAVRQLEGHLGEVFSARFSGDGEIVTAGGDGTVKTWDEETGQLRLTYRGSPRFLSDAVRSPDRSMIVAGGADGMLRFWDASSARLLWTLQAHKSHVVGVHFEGNDIVSRGFGGDISRWTLPDPAKVIEACSSCAIVAK